MSMGKGGQQEQGQTVITQLSGGQAQAVPAPRVPIEARMHLGAERLTDKSGRLRPAFVGGQRPEDLSRTVGETSKLTNQQKFQMLGDVLESAGAGVTAAEESMQRDITAISPGGGARLNVGGQAPGLGFATLLSRIASSTGSAGRNF